MDTREWDAISHTMRELVSYISVKELVFYLIEGISDPPPGISYSPLDISVEQKEIMEFNDHSTKVLLDYLRRRKLGFQLLCNALHDARQGFLADVLVATLDRIPEVDSPHFYVPESRCAILHSIAERFQQNQHYINLFGERGVGTSSFMKQVTSYLRDKCYFTVYSIDLADTPLVLQKEYFVKLKYEIVSKVRAMKKYCVLCIDNCNSLLLEQQSRHQDYQEEHVKAWINSCSHELGISLLTTSTEPRAGLENVEITKLSVSEMIGDIERMFPRVTDTELGEISRRFPHSYCNPLDCFLITTLYLLHNRTMSVLDSVLNRTPRGRDELFAAVFGKLDRYKQDILLAVYSLPCNARVSITSIFCLYSGTSRPLDERQQERIESWVAELVELNLLQQLSEQRYSMRDSNFFYHFRTFFSKKHPKRLRVFYLRGLHHYLDYIIKFIHDVKGLNVSNQGKESEWQSNIPCISMVLDPVDTSLETGLLRKPNLSKDVFIKRMFIIERLRNMTLDIPAQIIVLAARHLLNDFDTHHTHYAETEDKAKLLCLITELTLTPHYSVRDSRENLTKALVEVRALLEKEKSAALRVKYYMRILVPLAEIYVREQSYEKAKNCLRECLKLQCDNKIVNWMLRKRLRYVEGLIRGAHPVEASSPISPVDVSNKNFLSQDIKYHLEMGDSFYLRGDLQMAFNYYFELYLKYHNKHMHLKEQEYIALQLGHLKLQQNPYLTISNITSAIKFYEQSNTFFKLRKHYDNEFLKICLLTTNLLARNKGLVRRMVLEFRNAQGHTKTEFFIAVTHRDTAHRFLWRELTHAEKEHHTNRVKTTAVNYHMLEKQHYAMKLSQFESTEKSRFLVFPSPTVLDSVDEFDPSPLLRQNDLHMGIYIKIASTRI